MEALVADFRNDVECARVTRKDGKILAFSCKDCKAHIYEAHSFAILNVLKRNTKFVTSMCFSTAKCLRLGISTRWGDYGISGKYE